MVQVYVKLYYFVIKENDFSPNDLWEEMMELHDELDPKNNRNKICYNTICECPYFHIPLVDFVDSHPSLHLVSLDGLVFNILDLVQSKVTAALTCMFGDICPCVNYELGAIGEIW